MAALLFAIAFGSQMARADNLVTNGGFETGSLTGWTESDDNPSKRFAAVAVAMVGQTVGAAPCYISPFPRRMDVCGVFPFNVLITLVIF
jgi:hypothetical protein